MGLFGIQTKRDKELKEIRQANQQLVDMVKSATYSNNNEFARQMYQSLIKNISTLDYNLIKLINEGYAMNPHIFTVINKILKPMRQVPWVVYEVKDKVQKERFLKFKEAGRIEEAELFAKKSFERVEGTHLNKIFDDEANETQTWSDFLESWAGNYLLSGNAYDYILRPAGFKYPTKIYELPSQLIEIVPSGNWKDPIEGYRIAFSAEQNIPFKKENIIHTKTFNPNYSSYLNDSSTLYGMSPLQPLCRKIKRSNEAILASLMMLMNGFPPGILTDATAEFGNPLSDTQVKELNDKYISKFGGGRNANKPLVSPIALKWIAMGLNAVDLGIEDADKNDKKSFASLYNVPLPLIDDDNSSYNNIKEAKKELYTGAIIPLLTIRRDTFNKNFVAPYNQAEGKEYWVDFDLKAIPELQDDKKTKSDMLLSQMEHGLWKGNEVLYMLDHAMDETDPLLNQRILSNNLKYIDVDNVPEGLKKTLAALNSMSPLLATQAIQSLTETELRDLLSRPPLGSGDETIRSQVTQPTIISADGSK